MPADLAKHQIQRFLVQAKRVQQWESTFEYLALPLEKSKYAY